MADETPPLLVVKGVSVERLVRARTVGRVVTSLVLIGSLLAGTYAFAGNMNTHMWRGAVFLIFLGAYVGERYMRPQTGYVEFSPDRIVFVKQRAKPLQGVMVVHRAEVPWGDVKGFNDGRAEFVSILTKQGGSSFHTIPTLTEADRVAVLKFLDEKGVPRVE